MGKISLYNIEHKMMLLYGIKLEKQYFRDKENNVPANSGQIVQEYLSQRKDEGFVYTFLGKGLPRKQHPRKCLLHVYKDLTMPVDRPSRDIHDHCREKILSGEIDIGANIVERQL